MHKHLTEVFGCRPIAVEQDGIWETGWEAQRYEPSNAVHSPAWAEDLHSASSPDLQAFNDKYIEN